MMSTSDLLKQLEELRISRNWSQRRMALALGVSPACYHFWREKGRRPSPLAKRAIADFLSRQGKKKKVELGKETCESLFSRFMGWLAPFRSHILVFDTETGKCRIVKALFEGLPPREEIPFPETGPLIPQEVVDRLWEEHERWGDELDSFQPQRAEGEPPPRFVRVPYLPEATELPYGVSRPKLYRILARMRREVRKQALKACREWLAKLGEERGIVYAYDPKYFGKLE